MEARLLTLLKQDPLYQKLLSSCEKAEQAYLRILAGLNPEDQALLEQYITLCEELDHRKLQLILEHPFEF